MAGSKWIPGTWAKQRIIEAARLALELRLRQVVRLLPLAAFHAEDDVEHVHQLRVASRRAVATLDVFSDLLPAQRRKWVRKQLQRVRRAAGEARDYDVMLARFASEPQAGELAAVSAHLRELRHAAQPPLIDIARRLGEKKWESRLADLCEAVRWRGRKGRQPSFVRAAKARLRPALANFLRASRADFADLEAVHQFRIAGKKLRYAMEIFAGAMPKEFRKTLYPRIEDLQERLGLINDHATSARRFESWAEGAASSPLKQQFLDLAQREREQLRSASEEFGGWWTPERGQGWRADFAKYLQ